jgi:hypothetical protein
MNTVVLKLDLGRPPTFEKAINESSTAICRRE